MLSQTVMQALIVLLGIAGLGVSTYLHYKKKTTVDSMACPMDGSCEDVITSKYSKFLGFDVEILGILYYATIIIAYTIFLFTPQVAPAWFTFGVMMTSIAAVLFSAYLTFIQAFTLRMWCTWCLTSAAFCAAILGLAVPASTVGFEALMTQFSSILFWGVILGSAVGLGTAVSYAVLLFASLRDFEISDTQASMLTNLSHITWFALATVTVSGIGLYFGDTSIAPANFAVAAFIAATLVLNDSFYSLFLSEKLIDLEYSISEEDNEEPYLRQYVSMLAAMSVYSWAALLTIQLFQTSMNMYNQISLYLAGLAIVGFLGLITSKVEDMRAKEELPDWSPLH